MDDEIKRKVKYLCNGIRIGISSQQRWMKAKELINYLEKEEIVSLLDCSTDGQELFGWGHIFEVAAEYINKVNLICSVFTQKYVLCIVKIKLIRLFLLSMIKY